MSAKLTTHRYHSMNRLVTRLRDDLNGGNQDFLAVFPVCCQFTLPEIFEKPAARVR